MITNTQYRNVVTEGINETTQMRISNSPEVEAHIVKVLTENYKYPIESSIREQISNHYDAYLEKGAKDGIISIKLYKSDNNYYTLETSDEALGMNLQEFDKYYMGIGESSKRNSAELLGSKGCGSKSWLSILDSYNVITRKDGKEWSFLVFKGNVFPERTILYEKDTNLPNGVTIKTQFHRNDYHNYIKAIKQETCYFSNCYYEVEGYPELNQCKIYENDLFRWSDMYPRRTLHVSFGPCHYNIEWDILGIERIDIPVAIKIPIDSGIDVHFNRESFVYDERCKQLILSKIAELADWFVDRYNSTNVEFDSLKQALPTLQTEYKYVQLLDDKVRINSILKYSSKQLNPPNIKGVSLISPYKYERNLKELLREYKIVAELKYNGVITSERARQHYSNMIDYNSVIISKDVNITGFFKGYLKTLGYKLFVKKDSTLDAPNLTYFIQLLDLKSKPKNTWRSIITEWNIVKEQFIKDVLADGTNLHNSQEFINWKNANKSNPTYSSYVSKKLNKQKGDITIHVPRNVERGKGYTFEKKVYNLETIHRQPYKFIVFNEEDKNLALSFTKNVKVRNHLFVHITKGELKKLPNTKKFEMFVKINTGRDNVELFKNLATALKYKQAYEEYQSITENIHRTVLESLSNNVSNHAYKLRDYANKYQFDASNEVINAIIDNVKEFDLTLDAEYKSIIEFNKKFSFLQFMTCEYRNVDKFKKEVNKQLLMRKKFNPSDYENILVTVNQESN